MCLSVRVCVCVSVCERESVCVCSEHYITENRLWMESDYLCRSSETKIFTTCCTTASNSVLPSP